MADDSIILRKWSGRIRTTDEEKYGAYVVETGMKDYDSTEGNLGYQMMMRPMGDGTSEVTTISWWISMEAIRRFAGDQPELARYYPEDDKFLLEKPKYVEHHRVIAGRVNLSV